MACIHEPYHCSKVSYPWPYAVTRAWDHPDGSAVAVFIRWSTPDDPPFPCLCTCCVMLRLAGDQG